MGGLRYAVAFLTRIPWAAKGSPKTMLGWFWVPGMLYGFLWVGLADLAPVWSLSVSAVLALAGETLLSGGLHWDGWVDVFDGWGASSERVQEARKDHRMGALGGIFLVLGVAAMGVFWRRAVLVAGSWPLLFGPWLARSAMALATAYGPMDQESRLARWIQEQTQPGWAWLSVAIPVAFLLWIWPGRGGDALAVLAVADGAFLYGWIRRFQGLNGDVIGALAIFTEIVWLFLVMLGF